PPCSTMYTVVRFSRRLIEAMSCAPDSTLERCGSLAALSGSKLAASSASLKRPCSRSTTRARMRSANSALTRAADMPASPRPAMARMLRCLSSWRFSAWVGLSATAAPATNTEHTRHTRTATVRVRRVDSLLATGEPPLDVGLHHEMIDQRCTEVGEQNRQHHALGESRVDHPDQHYHHADQR